MTGTVLILGASGTFGSAAAQAFTKGGWQVRRYARGTDMTEAAKGADLIINALNPQGYKNWDTEIPRITSQVLTAARHSGATVLVPGNVYNFGTQGGTWSAETPSAPPPARAAPASPWRQPIATPPPRACAPSSCAPAIS